MSTVELASGVTVAIGSTFDDAAFTLTDEDSDDRRVMSVASVSDTLAGLCERCSRQPHAAAICVDVLRAVDPDAPALAGVITESLAYSTLQSGPEFARWLADRGPATVPDIPDPVQAERIGRWRTAYLVLSGETIDAATALRWGLIDEIKPQPAKFHRDRRNVTR